MSDWNRFTADGGSSLDMLGFAAQARPTPDEWLRAFTGHFMQHGDAEYGAQALMSGLRFYTPDFVGELACLPAIESRQPPLGADLPTAIYAGTGAIIVDLYQNRIGWNAGRADLQVACKQAMTALVARSNGAMQ